MRLFKCNIFYVSSITLTNDDCWRLNCYGYECKSAEANTKMIKAFCDMKLQKKIEIVSAAFTAG